MSNKNIIIFLIVLLIAGAALVFWGGSLLFTKDQNQLLDDESAAVENTVTQFGLQLKQVSLLSPDVKTAIQQHYSSLVIPELLAQWIQDPLKAPGRLTSSPSPDHIEIDSTKKLSDGTYEVKGNIIEVTSAQGEEVKIPVTVKVEKRDDKWLISSFVMGSNRAFKNDLIIVFSPLQNQTVTSPLTITGQARGNWYFEASFPVKLLDANNKVLVQAPAQAQGEWMTTDYVPFSVTLTFAKPTTSTGTLVLEKDNPSGLPEHANELRIPVKFDTNQAAQRDIKLYYYNQNKDKDAAGNVLCSRQGLVAVDRQISSSQTPIQDTIKLLLQGQLTQQEKSQGISTEFPLSGVTLKSANLSGGVLTLEFTDPQNKTSGGACRAGILWYQIEATAKQFSEVKSVRFIPETLFQP